MLSGEIAAADGRSGAEGTGMCGEGEVELTNQAENEEAGQYTQEEAALAQQTGGMNWNRAKTQKNKTEQKMKEWKAES